MAQNPVKGLWSEVKRHPSAKWLLGLSAASVAYVIIRRFLDAWLDNVITEKVQPPVIAFLTWLVSQPVGAVLLICAVWFVVLATWRAYDGSEFSARRRRARGGVAALTPDERIEIERIREAWLGAPERACEFALRLLGDATRYFVRNRDPFAGLLSDKCDALNQSLRAVNEGLVVDSTTTFKELQVRLVKLIADYRSVVAWINRCRRYEPKLLEQAEVQVPVEGFNAWLGWHATFAHNMDTLSKRSMFSHADIGLEGDANEILLNNDRWGSGEFKRTIVPQGALPPASDNDDRSKSREETS